MIEKLKIPKSINWDNTEEGLVSRHIIINNAYEKINEIIDWINDVSALRVTDKQVTANLPNIDAGELAFLSKENSDLQDELERTRKALDLAVDMLKEIDKTRSVANHKIGTRDKTLNSGIVFCWTTPDDIHNALEQITAQEQKD